MKRRYKNSKGFTLVEVIIAIVLTAILMTAVAVAFDASVKNYTENEKIYQSMSKARQALMRITANVRAASSIALPAYEANNKCTMVTSEGKNYTYDYRTEDSSLYIVDNDTSIEYLLCDDVTGLTFTKTTGNLDGITVVKDLRIYMEVTVDGQTKTLNAAAVVRTMLE